MEKSIGLAGSSLAQALAQALGVRKCTDGAHNAPFHLPCWEAKPNIKWTHLAQGLGLLAQRIFQQC